MFNIRAPAHETSGINIKCSILGIYVNSIFFLEEKSNGSIFNSFQNYKKKNFFGSQDATLKKTHVFDLVFNILLAI